MAASREALADPVPSDMWRARLLSLLALVQRAGIGELDGAEASARAAIEAGERAADPFAIGQALAVLHAIREPDEAGAAAGDADVWQRMVEASIANADPVTNDASSQTCSNDIAVCRRSGSSR